MAERLVSMTVVLKDNIHEDEARDLIMKIRELNGVVSVSGNVVKCDEKDSANFLLTKNLLDIV